LVHILVRGAAGWSEYVHSFHADHPGITERAFRHTSHSVLGTPYDWLLQGIDAPLGRVLDVACGNAALLPWLVGHESYLGVDTSEAEVARAQALGRGPVALADARELPLTGDSVDTVVSSMGLMLVDPVQKALSEIRRVLVPGGVLAVLVPSLWPVSLRDARLGLPLALALRGPGSMPQQLSGRRLRGLLTDAGLTVVDVARQRFAFPVLSPEHAALAVRSLYTPGRNPHALARAEALLARLSGPSGVLPVPLLRVVARG
jgi:SAM-dependent methyltransferase